MYVCVDIDPLKEGWLSYTKVLRADPSIYCNSDWYYYGFSWAVVMTILYPIGFIFVYFVFLYAFREEISSRSGVCVSCKDCVNDDKAPNVFLYERDGRSEDGVKIGGLCELCYEKMELEHVRFRLLQELRKHVNATRCLKPMDYFHHEHEHKRPPVEPNSHQLYFKYQKYQGMENYIKENVEAMMKILGGERNVKFEELTLFSMIESEVTNSVKQGLGKDLTELKKADSALKKAEKKEAGTSKRLGNRDEDANGGDGDEVVAGVNTATASASGLLSFWQYASKAPKSSTAYLELDLDLWEREGVFTFKNVELVENKATADVDENPETVKSEESIPAAKDTVDLRVILPAMMNAQRRITEIVNSKNYLQIFVDALVHLLCIGKINYTKDWFNKQKEKYEMPKGNKYFPVSKNESTDSGKDTGKDDESGNDEQKRNYEMPKGNKYFPVIPRKNIQGSKNELTDSGKDTLEDDESGNVFFDYASQPFGYVPYVGIMESKNCYCCRRASVYTLS